MHSKIKSFSALGVFLPASAFWKSDSGTLRLDRHPRNLSNGAKIDPQADLERGALVGQWQWNQNAIFLFL